MLALSPLHDVTDLSTHPCQVRDLEAPLAFSAPGLLPEQKAAYALSTASTLQGSCLSVYRLSLASPTHHLLP